MIELIDNSSIDVLDLQTSLIKPVLAKSMEKSSKYKYVTSVTVVENQPTDISNVIGNVWDETKDGYFNIQIEVGEVKLMLNYTWIHIG